MLRRMCSLGEAERRKSCLEAGGVAAGDAVAKYSAV